MADGVGSIAIVGAAALIGYAAYQYMQGTASADTTGPAPSPASSPAPAPMPAPVDQGGGYYGAPYYPPPSYPSYPSYPYGYPMPPVQSSNIPSLIQHRVPGLPLGTEITARTLWAEARGQSAAARQGVLSVIANRVKDPRWPNTFQGVCLAQHSPYGGTHYDFSSWNLNDPNRAPALAVTTANPAFQSCIALAKRAVARTLADNTQGANYYHDSSIATPYAWRNFIPTVQLGAFLFFRSPAGTV